MFHGGVSSASCVKCFTEVVKCSTEGVKYSTEGLNIPRSG